MGSNGSRSDAKESVITDQCDEELRSRRFELVSPNNVSSDKVYEGEALRGNWTLEFWALADLP